MEANKKLTNYLEQLTTELKELKAPIKTEYRIEGIDQLETKIKDILQQARVIGQKPESQQFAKPGTYQQLS
ncbi:unnamed protein product, partial [Rotaria sp. Silwood1]